MNYDFSNLIKVILKIYLIVAITILLLLSLTASAQIEVKQTPRGLFAIGTTPTNQSFVLGEVQNQAEIFEFLDNRLKRYVAGALVYEPKYDITIRVFPLHKDKVLILYKGKQDKLNYSKEYCYYKN